ncbi:MAG: hypothetical protein M1829_003667 [Trizodia sp. TS-e1964]|nr:MAG: hypothetical protein M1829_003667 [Trizodia sp. TS-e1964]
MGEAEIKVSQWRLAEVGRVVLFQEGPYAGRLATIVEIIDHKRALVDGPSESGSVPRHSTAFAKIVLTPIVISNLPRGARTGAVKKKWLASEVDKKWEASSWAKKRHQKERRRQLTDFERFKVMRLKKQARFEVRKTFAKVHSAAKEA